MKLSEKSMKIKTFYSNACMEQYVVNRRQLHQTVQNLIPKINRMGIFMG